MKRHAVHLVAAALALAGACLVAPPPAGAAGPSLSVPGTAAPGDVLPVVVSGCAGTAAATWFRAHVSSAAAPIVLAAGPGADQQSGSLLVPDADIVVQATCDGTWVDTNDGSGRVDVATTWMPTVTVAPEHPAWGEATTITVTGCAEAASGWVSETDILLPLGFVAAGPDTWAATFTAGREDQWFTVHCPGWFGTEEGRDLDVEHPFLRFRPYSLLGGYGSPLTGVTGTDCPAGTLPDVTFTGGGSEWIVTPGALSDRGDWEVDLPDFSGLPPRTEVTVTATCGSVTYDPIAAEFGAERASTTSSTTTRAPTVPGPGPDAVPATPVAGDPAFTG